MEGLMSIRNKSLFSGILLGLAFPGIAGVIESEFESGTLEGGASIYYSETASGGAAAGWLHGEGAAVRLENVDGGLGGEKSAVLLYSTDAANIRKVFYVNDVPDTLVLPNTGGYAVFSELPMTLNLNPGRNNTIVIRQGGHPGGANFDKISIDLGDEVTSLRATRSEVEGRFPAVRLRNGILEMRPAPDLSNQSEAITTMDIRGRLIGRSHRID